MVSLSAIIADVRSDNSLDRALEHQLDVNVYEYNVPFIADLFADSFQSVRDVSQGPEGLELLAHVGRMDQL